MYLPAFSVCAVVYVHLLGYVLVDCAALPSACFEAGEKRPFAYRGL